MEVMVRTWRPGKRDKETWADFTTLLAEYFSVYKSPLSRFDIAHLFNFWDSMSHPVAGVLIAYVDGVPAGCVMIETMPERDTRPYGHEISRLYVRSQFQGRGISKLLMRCAISRIKDQGYERAFLLVDSQNEQVLSMYRRMGFVTCERAQEAGTEGVCYLEVDVNNVCYASRPATGSTRASSGGWSLVPRRFVTSVVNMVR